MATQSTDQLIATPFVSQPGKGRRENVTGVTHLYKAASGQTCAVGSGSGFTLIEAHVPPGTGAPMHVHTHEDEACYVLSGAIVVEGEGVPGGGLERMFAGLAALTPDRLDAAMEICGRAGVAIVPPANAA
jgi:hypothetical protein